MFLFAHGGALRVVVAEELVEVPVLHVLNDDTERVFLGAHPQHAHYIAVLQLGHDLDLLVEVISARIDYGPINLLFLLNHSYISNALLSRLVYE